MNRLYQMRVEYMVKASYECRADSVAQAMKTMEGMLADDIKMERKADAFVPKRVFIDHQLQQDADYQLYVLDESEETAA